MMSDISGISGPAAGQAEITLDGQTYLIGPITLRDFATVEKHLVRQKRKQRQQMTLDLRDDMPPDLWQKEWEVARREAAAITRVDPEEVAGTPPKFDDDGNMIDPGNIGWIDTVEGMGYTLWLMFERSNPGKFTLEELIDKLNQMDDSILDDIKESRDQAGTLDQIPQAVKNSESSAATEPAAEPKNDSDGTGTISSGD